MLVQTINADKDDKLKFRSLRNNPTFSNKES